MRFAVLFAGILWAQSVLALPTPGDFLSHRHMPLLVRVSADSDLRIQLLRGGKVVSESSKKTIGSWKVEQSTLKIKYKLGNAKIPAMKELSYDLKIIPNTAVASGAELKVNGVGLQFTNDEEQILDVNFSGISEALKGKCTALQKSLATSAASEGGPLGSPGPDRAGKFTVSDGGLSSTYVQNGVKADGSISIVSENGWDCSYRSRFIVDEKLFTCGVVSFVLHHCAK